MQVEGQERPGRRNEFFTPSISHSNKQESPTNKSEGLGAGEMAQWLRALTALPEVLSSNPSNHMMAHNHL